MKKLTDSKLISHQKGKHCYICHGEFDEKKNENVRDHCYFTGNYRGPSHSECNTPARKPKFLPAVFHNLQGYDAHLFIKELGKKKKKK